MIGDVFTSATTADEDSTPAASEADRASPRQCEDPSELSKDIIFGLLSVKRRRRVLNYLTDTNGHTTLSDLAEYIAAQEHDTEIRLLDSQQRKRVYVALYQCHLPKLDDADVIEFDRSRGTIERRPTADQLYPYLALDPPATTENDAAQSDERTALRETLTEYLP